MHINYKFFTILGILILVAANLWSESSTTNEDLEWIFYDAPQVSESELSWLNTILKTTNHGAALNFIDEKIENGEISSADESTIAVLSRILTYPHNYLDRASPYISDRQKAVQLLSKLGGEHSLNALDRVLAIESDSVVLKAIYRAYAQLSPGISQHRSTYFTAHLKRASRIETDDSLAIVILEAIENMYKNSNSPIEAPLFAEIITIMEGAQTQRAAEQALALARLISGL